VSTWVENAIGDLLAVPGLRGLMLLDATSTPKMYRLDHEVGAETVDAVARGISQVVRKLRLASEKIELRYEKGRFYIRPLQGGLVIAIFTDPRPNIPLLSLALDTLVQAAATDRDKVLETFKASELLRGRVEGSNRPPRSQNGAPRLLSDDVASAARAPTSGETFESGFAIASMPPVADEAPNARSSVRVGVEKRSHVPDGTDLTTHDALAAALTGISAGAARYLGRSVIANYWRQCQRPAAKELFETRQDGSIRAFAAATASDDAARAAASEWARTFVERCALIVMDIRDGLLATLDERARALLEAPSTKENVA